MPRNERSHNPQNDFTCEQGDEMEVIGGGERGGGVGGGGGGGGASPLSLECSDEGCSRHYSSMRAEGKRRR